MRRSLDIGREDNRQLEISTHYSLGGKSFMTGRNNTRGLYVHFTLTNTKKLENGDYVVTTALMSEDNFKILYRECQRQAPKVHNHLDNALNGCVDKLAILYSKNDREAIYKLVKAL